MDQSVVKGRLRLMLDHFARVGDPREACKVKYPLGEILFLVTCATIARCDDDEIADGGRGHQNFLKHYGEFLFGAPKEDWLQGVLNRIDPALFEACFTAWTRTVRPDAPDLIALDGKTVRRSGHEAAGLKPIHLVSAWAELARGRAKRSLVEWTAEGSTQRLVLAQQAVGAKINECAAILAILDHLPVKGALVTIDAIVTNPTVAAAITAKGGNDVLALEGNQPTLHDEVETDFDDPASGPSKPPEKLQDAVPKISQPSSTRDRVNLDSLPCPPRARPCAVEAVAARGGVAGRGVDAADRAARGRCTSSRRPLPRSGRPVLARPLLL